MSPAGGQKERPAVSAAGLGTPLGSEYEKPTTQIPADAIEAAWWAMPKGAYVDNQDQVRAMLEAAAPYMQAANSREDDPRNEVWH